MFNCEARLTSVRLSAPVYKPNAIQHVMYCSALSGLAGCSCCMSLGVHSRLDAVGFGFTIFLAVGFAVAHLHTNMRKALEEVQKSCITQQLPAPVVRRSTGQLGLHHSLANAGSRQPARWRRPLPLWRRLPWRRRLCAEQWPCSMCETWHPQHFPTLP
jgi:hypothetical protein